MHITYGVCGAPCGDNSPTQGASDSLPRRACRKFGIARLCRAREQSRRPRSAGRNGWQPRIHWETERPSCLLQRVFGVDGFQYTLCGGRVTMYRREFGTCIEDSEGTSQGDWATVEDGVCVDRMA